MVALFLLKPLFLSIILLHELQGVRKKGAITYSKAIWRAPDKIAKIKENNSG